MSKSKQTEWISAPEALRRLNTQAGSRTCWTILSRAKVGLIPARADCMIFDAEERHSLPEERRENIEVPLWFWQNCCGQESSLQKWEVSDFQGKGRAEGTLRMVRLFGVEFDAAAVAKIPAEPARTPAPQSEAVSEAPKNKGGNPGKVKVWHEFYLCLMQMWDNGELDNISSQSALREELLKRINEQLDDGSIKQPVREFWHKVLRRH